MAAPSRTIHSVIPFFLGYLLAVWWPAAAYRRRWPSFVAVAVGTAGLLAMIEGHRQLALASDGEMFAPVFQSLLIPYAILVSAGGLYISLLPRAHPKGHCGACGYPLYGLAAGAYRCPECGRAFMVKPRATPQLPSRQAPEQPQQEHAQRQAGDQPPCDRAALAG